MPIGFREKLTFFTALLLSAFGYEFLFFVLTLKVYDINHNPFYIGVFTALAFLPRLFSTFMGAVTDRYSHKVLYCLCNAAIAVLVLFLALTSGLVGVYIIWLLISIFLTAAINIRTSLMTDLMSKGNYLWGNSLTLAALNTAKVFGPLAGGVLVASSGINILLYFTITIYFTATLIIFFINVSNTKQEANWGLFKHLRTTLNFFRENVNFKILAFLAIIWRLFLALQLSLFVIYVKTYLNGGNMEYGFFLSTVSVGSICGSLAGPWLMKRQPVAMPWLIAGLSIHYLSFTVLGLIRDYNLSLIVLFLSYFIFYATVVGVHSLRDKSTLASLRGSAYGSVTAMTTPAAIISMLAGGYFCSRFGVNIVLFGAGLGAMLLTLLVLLIYKTKISITLPEVNTANITK